MKKARIYKPSKTAMQSGRGKAHDWILEFARSERLGPENLMGWTQSGDTLNQIRLRFKSLDDAKTYADKEGLQYSIAEESVRSLKPRNYGDNFKYIPYEESK